jgi:excisionase family DNA binding protein
MARPLLRVLVRALAREVREDGGIIPPGIDRFLSDLAAVVDHPPPGGSGPGTGPAPPATVEVPTTVAAEVIGASPEYVRRLCRTGRLPARRIGRAWLISLDRRTLDHHEDQDHGYDFR